MTSLAPLNGGHYYSYVEGVFRFQYYPESGLVKATNTFSWQRSIEHFARRGFDIVWEQSNPIRLTLMIEPPEYLSKEEALTLIGQTKKGLVSSKKAAKEAARAKKLSQNVDSTTGEPFTKAHLTRAINNMRDNPKKCREDVIEWFNRYNLGDIRPLKPLLIKSTKPKNLLIEEGRTLVIKLFDKGLLRKLTQEEYLAKIEGGNDDNK